MGTEFELEWHKSKDKDLTLLFINKLNVSDFSALFFFLLETRLKLGSRYRE